jgi:hypothetical protein
VAPKKLTAFISSTSLDLPEHRKQVSEACLRQNVFPDGTSTRSDEPPCARPDYLAARVARRSYHSCGIRRDGTLACWGSDDYGQAAPPEGRRLRSSNSAESGLRIAGHSARCARQTGATTRAGGTAYSAESCVRIVRPSHSEHSARCVR